MPPIKLPNRRTEVTAQLTETEQAQAGRELVHLMEDYTQKEVEQKDLKDQMKAQLAEIDAKIQAQRIKVSRGQELRTVDVLVTLYPEGVDGGAQPVVQEVRSDTGAIINTRPPYPDEMQGVLPEKPGVVAEDGSKIAGETGVAQVSSGEGWEQMTSETDRKNAEEEAKRAAQEEITPPLEKKRRGRRKKTDTVVPPSGEGGGEEQ
jgi:hypothetical protein